VRLPLRVQPVSIYTQRQRREQASWRWSAEIYGESQVAKECARKNRELEILKRGAASARNTDVLEVLAKPDKRNLVFLRHESGPMNYMYIGLHGPGWGAGASPI
jgi:hypothetical protein